MQIAQYIKEKVKDAVLKTYDVEIEDVFLEHPGSEKWGDYATNISMTLGKKLQQSPGEIARKLCYELCKMKHEFEVGKKQCPIFEKIEFAPSGFINFKFSREWLQNVPFLFMGGSKGYRMDSMRGENVMVEYTDPNPFKVFHIGHLMTNVIGESLSRLYQVLGANVHRANYQGDVGMHVAKAIWGMLKIFKKEGGSIKDLGEKNSQERMQFLGRAYVEGATAFEKDPKAKEEMQDINYLVFAAAQEILQKEGWQPKVDYRQYISSDLAFKYEEIFELYEKGRSWSLECFEAIYQRLGTKFDHYYFESMVGEYGYQVVQEYLQKGIFVKDQGAVVFKGEDLGLHTRVFINSLGLPTYESKDLGLAIKKYEDFKYDLSLIVTANEINEYFRVVLAALSLINPDLAAKTKHLGHGVMKLKTGKMSSRTGDIVAGVALIDDVKNGVLDKMKSGERSLSAGEKEKISDVVAIGAVKYSILKQGIGRDIIYNREESLSLEGNTGPYLQYTYARVSSVLKKAGGSAEVDTGPEWFGISLHEKESDILRYIYRFSEVVEEAALSFSPSLMCEFLFELAQKFNTFYNELPILGAKTQDQKSFRLALTLATGEVLKEGLWLLGISAPEEM